MKLSYKQLELPRELEIGELYWIESNQWENGPYKIRIDEQYIYNGNVDAVIGTIYYRDGPVNNEHYCLRCVKDKVKWYETRKGRKKNLCELMNSNLMKYMLILGSTWLLCGMVTSVISTFLEKQ